MAIDAVRDVIERSTQQLVRLFSARNHVRDESPMLHVFSSFNLQEFFFFFVIHTQLYLECYQDHVHLQAVKVQMFG